MVMIEYEKEEEGSCAKHLHIFEKELDELEDNLKKGFEDNDLLLIDVVRNFAFEKRSVLPESLHLLERANSILLRYYQNNLDILIEKMKNGANKDMIMEFSSLRYIMCRLENNKNLKQLEEESRKYAKEIISAGNRLAIVLGVAPLE